MWHIYKPHSIWCAIEESNPVKNLRFGTRDRMHLIYLLARCRIAPCPFFPFSSRSLFYFAIINRCLALKASSCLLLSLFLWQNEQQEPECHLLIIMKRTHDTFAFKLNCSSMHGTNSTRPQCKWCVSMKCCRATRWRVAAITTFHSSRGAKTRKRAAKMQKKN